MNQNNKSSFWSRLLDLLDSSFLIEELNFPPFFYWESDSSYMSKLANQKPIIPVWAKTATRIEAWDDLESVQELLINQIPDDSFLKKSFFINKHKLKMLEDKRLPSQKDENNIFRSIQLLPGQEVSFTFYCKAHNLLFERQYDTQFEISYIENESKVIDGQTVINKIAGIQNSRKTLTFLPSSYAVPFGTCLGGIGGFVIKASLGTNNGLSDFPTSKFWFSLIGAVMLSFVLAAVISKHDDTKKKFITVEDFAGGIFVGALAGLFSEQIIEYFKALVPSSKIK